MNSLFTFCLDFLAGAIGGVRTLAHTRQLLGVWPTLFPAPDLKEAQLTQSEWAVYLTAVARQSRSQFGTAWDSEAALRSVRRDFLAQSTAVEMPVAAARMLARRGMTTAAARGRRLAVKTTPSRKRASRRAGPRRGER